MSSRISKVALAGAFAASTALGQTMPEQVPVKRPDGTTVHPATAGSVQTAPEPGSAMRPDGTVVRPNASGITGTAPDPAVKRPDGTVVHPQTPVQRAPSSSFSGDSRTEERERQRQQAQRAAEERIDQSRREREAAISSPARQVAPTTAPR